MADHHGMMVVKKPTTAPVLGSPCSSPGPARYLAKQVSPVVESPQSPAVDPWRSEEKENLAPHSLSGRFPSVSTFKQYQNAAMAVIISLISFIFFYLCFRLINDRSLDVFVVMG